MPFTTDEERREYYRNKAYHKSESSKEYMRRYYQENKDRQRHLAFQKRYGITLNEYNDMREEQGNSCALCGIHEDNLTKKLHVDHCHETSIIRGLLCHACNTGIGLLNDDPDLLSKAIGYLNANRLS